MTGLNSCTHISVSSLWLLAQNNCVRFDVLSEAAVHKNIVHNNNCFLGVPCLLTKNKDQSLVKQSKLNILYIMLTYLKRTFTCRTSTAAYH